jgi:hypothetical protein
MKSIILFFECIFCWWNPRGQGDLKDAQIILTQAASDMRDSSSSTTNKLLAQAADMYGKKLNIPIFPQGEVAKVLDRMNVFIVGRTPCEAIPDNFGSKEYQGTSGVAMIQKKYCDEHRYSTVIVLAATPHTWRAKWTYEKLGLKVIIPPDSPPMVFEKNMNQRRWRRAITAYPYELKARLEYLFNGEI